MTMLKLTPKELFESNNDLTAKEILELAVFRQSGSSPLFGSSLLSSGNNILDVWFAIHERIPAMLERESVLKGMSLFPKLENGPWTGLLDEFDSLDKALQFLSETNLLNKFLSEVFPVGLTPIDLEAIICSVCKSPALSHVTSDFGIAFMVMHGGNFDAKNLEFLFSRIEVNSNKYLYTDMTSKFFTALMCHVLDALCPMNGKYVVAIEDAYKAASTCFIARTNNNLEILSEARVIEIQKHLKALIRRLVSKRDKNDILNENILRLVSIYTELFGVNGTSEGIVVDHQVQYNDKLLIASHVPQSETIYVSDGVWSSQQPIEVSGKGWYFNDLGFMSEKKPSEIVKLSLSGSENIEIRRITFLVSMLNVIYYRIANYGNTDIDKEFCRSDVTLYERLKDELSKLLSVITTMQRGYVMQLTSLLEHDDILPPCNTCIEHRFIPETNVTVYPSGPSDTCCSGLSQGHHLNTCTKSMYFGFDVRARMLAAKYKGFTIELSNTTSCLTRIR